MPIETPTRPATRRYYAELDALDLLLTSDYALGKVVRSYVSFPVDSIDYQPSGYPSLLDAFSKIVPDSDDDNDEVRQAYTCSLVAKLLRAITPELIDEAATHFENLAVGHLHDELHKAEGIIEACR